MNRDFILHRLFRRVDSLQFLIPDIYKLLYTIKAFSCLRDNQTYSIAYVPCYIALCDKDRPVRHYVAMSVVWHIFCFDDSYEIRVSCRFCRIN